MQVCKGRKFYIDKCSCFLKNPCLNYEEFYFCICNKNESWVWLRSHACRARFVSNMSTTCQLSTCKYPSVIRIYHVYIYVHIRMAVKDEMLDCTRAVNRFDSHAEAVMKWGVIVGHLPRSISTACFVFLRWKSTIPCQVSSSKQYSRDLP